MERIAVNGLALYFPAEEREAAERVRQACAATILLIRNSWGLELPDDVRVYVLTSGWLPAMFHGAPWRWRLGMAIALPLWYPRGRRLWQLAGGWQQQFGRRRVVCVKTPDLLAQARSDLGDRLFIREEDPEARLGQITGHELTHAFTAHLRLPPWLNEGLAMVTAERLAGKPTVRPESLALLEQPAEVVGSLSRQAVRRDGMEAVLALYARGYWRTRYLEETRPGLLRGLLAAPARPDDWNRAIAAAWGATGDSFWTIFDREVAARFSSTS